MKCRRENLDKTSLFSRGQRYLDQSLWPFAVRCNIDHNAYALYMYCLRVSHMSKFVDRLLILDHWAFLRGSYLMLLQATGFRHFGNPSICSR